MHRKTRVAISEEQTIFRLALEAVLKNAGVEIQISHSNNTDLLFSLEEQNTLPDICIIGINTYNNDTEETISYIKNTWPQLPLILLYDEYDSAKSDKYEHSSLMNYVSKNIDCNNFLNMINTSK